VSSRDSQPILVCYDRSRGSLRAIETAGELFPGRRAVVLHVWSRTAGVVGGYAAMLPAATYDDGESEAAAQDVAVEGARLASAAGLDAKPDITSAFEGTGRAILDAADRHEAALIVLGARGLSAVRSFLLGSVSHAVAQHAHCPVLVVPPPTQSDESFPTVDLIELGSSPHPVGGGRR
jgi:nucleotide-binding universal stress UspA family protein